MAVSDSLQAIQKSLSLAHTLTMSAIVYSKAMRDVVDSDDLMSLVFINWVDRRSCLAVLLTCKRFLEIYRLRIPGPIKSSVREHCARVELLEWALSMNIPARYLSRSCAEAGNLACLQWLRSQSPPLSQWTVQNTRAAARGGYLHVLEWLREVRPACPWDASVCSEAAAGGHLHVLQWLRSRVPPCPFGSATCAAAAGGGHLDVLKWLRAQIDLRASLGPFGLAEIPDLVYWSLSRILKRRPYRRCELSSLHCYRFVPVVCILKTLL